jgi:hypothetical protein
MNDSPQDKAAAVANAVHAARTWLSRLGAPAGAVAVVTVAPQAAVGVWAPGRASVLRVPLDDPGAELAESVAPIVEECMLRRLDESERLAAFRTIARGGKLQVMVAPALDGIVLRLLTNDGPVEIARVEVMGDPH